MISNGNGTLIRRSLQSRQMILLQLFMLHYNRFMAQQYRKIQAIETKEVLLTRKKPS